MPFARSRGARIHYVVHEPHEPREPREPHRPRAPLPTVVLLQGLGLSSRFWFDVPELLAHDPETPRRVIRIDNRGTGLSDKPRRLWTMGTMADDVVAVLDHAGVEGAYVVGISMGGMIAQHCALRHPSRVRGLVLIATTAGFVMGALPEARSLARLVSLPLGGKNASQQLVRLLLPESKWHRAKEIFRDWPSAMRDDPTAPTTFAAHLFAASTHLVTRHLSKIRCPAIVVAGAEDRLIPLENARVLARQIPRAELEVVAETGHAVFADDRDLVRRMVVRLERSIEKGLEAAGEPGHGHPPAPLSSHRRHG
jgi:3-oxoadipate enol-lactonase